MKKKGTIEPLKGIVRPSHIAFVLLSLILFINNQTLNASPAGDTLSQQQDKMYVIRGTVTDPQGSPMPGVTIRLSGTTLGSASDNDGNFVLRLPAAKGELQCSFIGYKTVKVNFSADQPLTIKMRENMENLEQVVVIGYGTQSKRELAGSVATIKGSDYESVPAVSIVNQMEGRLPGVMVNTASGGPGNIPQIIIRGQGGIPFDGGSRGPDPLYVIDGIPMLSAPSLLSGGSPVNDIDPADIESIDVLKDASAATIYGSRAANGVVLITTKKGKFNQKPKIVVNLSHTTVTTPFLPTRTGGNRERYHRITALQNYGEAGFDELTNSYTYPGSYEESYERQLAYNYFWNNGNGSNVAILQDSLNPFYNNSTDLFKYYFQTAHVVNADAQISGGAEKIAYNVTLGYYNEEGMLRGTGFNRFKAGSNLMMKPKENLDVNLGFYLARTVRDRSGKGNIYNLGPEAFIDQIPKELFTSSLYPGEGTPAFTELVKRHNETIEKNENYRLKVNGKVAYRFLRDFEFSVTGAIDYSQQNQHMYIPASLDEYNEAQSVEQIVRNLMWINENVLKYKHIFNEIHKVDFILGLSLQSEEMNSIFVSGRTTLPKQIEYIDSGNVYDKENDRALKDGMTDNSRWTLASWYSRLNLTLWDKLLLSASLRFDGSSKFGKDVRWGTFPAFGLGYILTEEPFMESIRSVLSFAKLRVSWGKTGKIFNDPYMAAGKYLPQSTFQGNSAIIPQWNGGMPNTTLTWEKSAQWNMGLDMDLFDRRISCTIDYYCRDNSSQLFLVEAYGIHSGYLNQMQNINSIRNQGIEIALNFKIFNRENLKWEAGFNIARNWNVLKKCSDDVDFQIYSNKLGENFINNINIKGKPVNSIYVLKDKGIYNSDSEVPYIYEGGKKIYLHGQDYTQHYRAGDRIFIDSDGSGSIYNNRPQYEDRFDAGSPVPLFTGGITSNLKWRDFDLSLLFNYALRRTVLNQGYAGSIGTTTGLSSMMNLILADLNHTEFWERPGDNVQLPINRADNELNNWNYALWSNIDVFNYLRLKNLTVGYTLPKAIQKKIHFGCRVYFTAENLFTVTGYKKGDPETIDLHTGLNQNNNVPLGRRFTIGTTLTF